MKPSRKFLSLPIVSLQEGQQIGYVKNLILDAGTKSLAAIIVDPKGFFKDQRIIPYTKVVSVGDDAITIDKESHVEKTSNLPELLELVKDKLTIIGTKMITESGKTLGIADEYYVDPGSGKITQIEISSGKLDGFLSGKAWMPAEYITTIGHDVIVTQKGSESALTVADKGISESFKNFLHSTSHLASETTHTLSSYFKKQKLANEAESSEEKQPIALSELQAIPSDEENPDEQSPPENPQTKEPLG
ncbi:PRC-barrel domain-containing protein [Desulfosporosinus sp. PR]|uniref:PRC-barrel domain-containing protein n=1 Tax=Candidatus Desulfosporosinus nitrosoreducens TaxID=3401928 RepID=UPI0027FC4CCF|nr:PRC-barrel domain-containing protein [Desulfosporosinus sp. PR]MDQ7092787.1 PRC-barrel domain-containing protein [Desulfosporosinus sp. PR]